MVAMSQYHTPLALEKCILQDLVVTAFYRNDLYLPAAFFKIVMGDDRMGRGERITRHPDTDRLSSITTQRRVNKKMVAVDRMIVLLASFVIQFYDQGRPPVQLIPDSAMVYPVMPAPKDDPAVRIEPARLA